jgi:2,3,4,5-tetrahydropyridine-2-carboxylate N-succinyltransferase
VLEPIGARPVIVEDDVFVGGGCGIYEGTRVGRRAVLAPGVVLSRAVPVFDLKNDTVLRAAGDRPLEVPEGAVVVPGSRRAPGSWAQEHGLQIYAPMIVKYRDESTDAAAALEQTLR